jgi:hypothetical protein
VPRGVGAKMRALSLIKRYTRLAMGLLIARKASNFATDVAVESTML